MFAIIIFGLLAITDKVYGADCNGLNFGEFSIPPGYCYGTSESGVEKGYKFECGTTPMFYLYDNTMCTGSAINSTEAVNVGLPYSCDGKDCDVVILTVYPSSGDCTASGDYSSVPLATDGCIELELNTSQTLTCSDKSLTSDIYDSSGCAGNSVTTVTRTSGCSGIVYYDIQCGAADKFLAMVVMVVVATCLAQ